MEGRVYTLELEGQKWYVGYSADVCTRIAQHFLGRGSLWTKTHPPHRVVAIAEGGKELENATTIALMAQKGWRNVRGGSWTAVSLKSIPLPLARALAIKHLRREAEVKDASYDYEGHAVDLVKNDDLWNARVTGPLAVLARPQDGVRILEGSSREDAKCKAELWIDSLRGQRDPYSPQDQETLVSEGWGCPLDLDQVSDLGTQLDQVSDLGTQLEEQGVGKGVRQRGLSYTGCGREIDRGLA